PRSLWHERAWCAALALAVVAALIAPFWVNNWIAFGDPFYSFDFATEFYRGESRLTVERPMDWAGFYGERFAGHPHATVDSFLRGLTTYPFVNKWAGLDYLSPMLSAVLRAAAIVGLALLLSSAEGRLLLVVLFSALISFAAVWQERGGSQWRLTVFSYPFYLLAACLALHAGCRLSSRDVRRRLTDSLRHERRRWTVGAMVAAGGLAISLVLPRWWQY